MAFRHPGQGPRGGLGLSGMFRITPAVKWLLIVNAGVWLLTYVLVRWIGLEVVLVHLALTPQRVVPGLELWQPATYMWMHSLSHPSHILFNMLGLWVFGTNLEERWGGRGFVTYYLATGIAAGLVVLASGWIFGSQDVMTVGASGSVYACVVAFGLLFPNRNLYLLGVVPIKGKWIVYGVLGITAVTWLMQLIPGSSYVASRGGVPQVSVAAHAGGMAAGALLLTGWWNPMNVHRTIRRALLKRRLRIVERQIHDPDDDDAGPMIH
jgi:membrane associated rhomboid family serine protease